MKEIVKGTEEGLNRYTTKIIIILYLNCSDSYRYFISCNSRSQFFL